MAIGSGTGSVHYDATNSQVVSHFALDNLAQSSYIGMSQVWDTGKTDLRGRYPPKFPTSGSRCLAVRR
jgi:hypothetical protein